MKITSVHYDDRSEIERIAVTMSLAEAAAIHAIGGKLNGIGMSRLNLSGDDSLYDAFSELFARHYDNGRPPDSPAFEFNTINNRPDGVEP